MRRQNPALSLHRVSYQWKRRKRNESEVVVAAVVAVVVIVEAKVDEDQKIGRRNLKSIPADRKV